MANPKDNRYRDDGSWVERMLDLYADGRSDIEVCKDLGITFKQFEHYMQTSTDFRDLVDRGRDYSQAWWYAKGRENIANKEFVTALWTYNMANRYGWSTKSESTKKDSDPVNIDKLKNELKQKMPELAALLGEPLDQRKMIGESSQKH